VQKLALLRAARAIIYYYLPPQKWNAKTGIVVCSQIHYLPPQKRREKNEYKIKGVI